MARSRPSPTGSVPAGHAGYTLTELLVVLAIMGLAAGLAPPILQTARQHFLTREAVYRLAAKLQAAHDQAIDTQTTIRIASPPATFYPDGSATTPPIHFDGATISIAPLSGRVDVSF